jgi:hypothetical protein
MRQNYEDTAVASPSLAKESGDVQVTESPVRQKFARNEIIVIKGNPSSSGIVESVSDSTVTVRCWRNHTCCTPSFFFDGEVLAVDVSEAENILSLGLTNQIFFDSFKRLFGNPDMTFRGAPYFLWMTHTNYGDIMFGRIINLAGTECICAGITEVRGKSRQSYNIVLMKAGKLVLVPLSKALSVSARNPPKFCNSSSRIIPAPKKATEENHFETRGKEAQVHPHIVL